MCIVWESVTSCDWHLGLTNKNQSTDRRTVQLIETKCPYDKYCTSVIFSSSFPFQTFPWRPKPPQIIFLSQSSLVLFQWGQQISLQVRSCRFHHKNYRDLFREKPKYILTTFSSLDRTLFFHPWKPWGFGSRRERKSSSDRTCVVGCLLRSPPDAFLGFIQMCLAFGVLEAGFPLLLLISCTNHNTDQPS